MRRFLKNATPETYLLFCAVVGVVLAAVASMIPGLDLGFVKLVLIFMSFDVLTYLAMKAGWIRTPAERRDGAG
jgi:hypothetical protein